MTDASDPTEPVAATEADSGPAPAATADPAVPARRRTVEVAWLWLALGALGCLLLGSLLTFVGTRAAQDDGPDLERIAELRAGRGGDDPGRYGGPRFHGGPGFEGPGFRGGPGPRFGPPQREQRPDAGDRDQDDDAEPEPDDSSTTTDTTG